MWQNGCVLEIEDECESQCTCNSKSKEEKSQQAKPKRFLSWRVECWIHLGVVAIEYFGEDQCHDADDFLTTTE